jgi:hypothetical protein
LFIEDRLDNFRSDRLGDSQRRYHHQPQRSFLVRTNLSKYSNYMYEVIYTYYF